MPTRFFQLHLRTTDVDSARAFYTAVLGDGARNIWQLHEQAIARGARPHWLGFLSVDDADRAAAAFVERGAAPLGPKVVRPDGVEAAVLRDPGGAVVAVAKPSASARAHAHASAGEHTLQSAGAAGAGADVVFHLLHTPNVEVARANYASLFGWHFAEPRDLGSLGVLHPFSWEADGPSVGALRDIASHPGVHPHWLFHFRVAALDPAMKAVQTAGGIVVDMVTLPSGPRIAICDDAQGAAFAMREES